MAATIISIADAVVAVLNGATLSQTFTAKRCYVPHHEQEHLHHLQVTVVPRSLVGTLLDRAHHNLYEYVVDVAFQKSIGGGPLSREEINVACDPLMQLAEEAGDLFDGKSLASTPVARCVDVKNEPIYVPAHIDEHRVFTSVLSLSFRLVK